MCRGENYMLEETCMRESYLWEIKWDIFKGERYV